MKCLKHLPGLMRVKCVLYFSFRFHQARRLPLCFSAGFCAFFNVQNHSNSPRGQIAVIYVHVLSL